jgi:hypothetical protein
MQGAIFATKYREPLLRAISRMKSHRHVLNAFVSRSDLCDAVSRAFLRAMQGRILPEASQTIFVSEFEQGKGVMNEGDLCPK